VQVDTIGWLGNEAECGILRSHSTTYFIRRVAFIERVLYLVLGPSAARRRNGHASIHTASRTSVSERGFERHSACVRTGSLLHPLLKTCFAGQRKQPALRDVPYAQSSGTPICATSSFARGSSQSGRGGMRRMSKVCHIEWSDYAYH
jgi:hypothetical protein